MRIDRTTYRAVGAAVATLLLCAGPAGAGETTAFHGNAAHDGAVAEAIGPPLRSAWVRELGDQGAMTALVAGGRVFTVRGAEPSDVRLHALDGATGETLWTVPVIDWRTTIAYESGTVFVSEDEEVRALDAATGARRWRAQLETGLGVPGPVVAAGGAVYVARQREAKGALHALRASDGGSLWTVTGIPWASDTSPTVGPDRVWLAYVGGQTYAFDRATGAQAWWSPGPAYGGGYGVAAYAGNRLFRFDLSREGAALDPATGESRFAFPAAHPPSLWGDTLVAPLLYDLGVFDATGGALRWRTGVRDEHGNLERVTPALVVNGVAWAGTETGRLFGVDLASGEHVWDRRTDAGRLYWLAAGDGRIVVSGATRIQAFEATPTSPQSPDPAAPKAPPPPPPSPPAPSGTPLTAPPPAGDAAGLRLRVPRSIAWATLRRRGLTIGIVGASDRVVTVSVVASGARCRVRSVRTRRAALRVRLPRACRRPQRLRVSVRAGSVRRSAVVRVR